MQFVTVGAEEKKKLVTMIMTGSTLSEEATEVMDSYVAEYGTTAHSTPGFVFYQQKY
jgi:hypothetical protein